MLFHLPLQISENSNQNFFVDGKVPYCAILLHVLESIPWQVYHNSGIWLPGKHVGTFTPCLFEMELSANRVAFSDTPNQGFLQKCWGDG